MIDRAAVRQRAVWAAVVVAGRHGIEVREPRVLGDHSNLLVGAGAGAAGGARRDGARSWLARDVAVASFLAAWGAAVVPPASELPPGPHVEDGLAISFWRPVASDPDRGGGCSSPSGQRS